MNFERGQDIKKVLDLGIARKLPAWMKDSGYNYHDHYDIWNWAIKESKNIIFPYLVEKNGTKWHGNVIHFGMETNNDLLWQSISERCLPAVQAILKIPDLFAKEVLNLKVGTSVLPECYYRGDTKCFYRATNFGAYVSLAANGAKGKFELQDTLMTYYRKYNDEL